MFKKIAVSIFPLSPLLFVVLMIVWGEIRAAFFSGKLVGPYKIFWYSLQGGDFLFLVLFWIVVAVPFTFLVAKRLLLKKDNVWTLFSLTSLIFIVSAVIIDSMVMFLIGLAVFITLAVLVITKRVRDSFLIFVLSSQFVFSLTVCDLLWLNWGSPPREVQQAIFFEKDYYLLVRSNPLGWSAYYSLVECKSFLSCKVIEGSWRKDAFQVTLEANEELKRAEIIFLNP